MVGVDMLEASCVSIIAIPSRMAEAEALRDKWLSVGVPSVHIFNDSERRGVNWNSNCAWEWLSEQESEFSVFCTDDAEPCKDFEYAVERTVSALRAISGHWAVSYLNWTRFQTVAVERGCGWLVGDSLYDQCWLAPTRTVRKFVREFVPNRIIKAEGSADYFARAFFKVSGIPVYSPVPAPFQHAEPSRSSLGNANKTRICREFVTGSAFDIDWTKPISEAVRLPSFMSNKEVEKWFPLKDGAA